MSTNILCIETSTTACSVALCNENDVLSSREENNGYTHAEKLHMFIEDVLKESGLPKTELAAIAVGKGPGSYTGLRIGVSAAKGLSYALDIPLLSVNSLLNMATQVKALGDAENKILCPMLDARRMEVYTALYNGSDLSEISTTNAIVVNEESITTFNTDKDIVFFGDGMNKCRDLLNKLPKSRFIFNLFPTAQFMYETAYRLYMEKAFEDTAYFEPFYLKEFYTGPKPGQLSN